MESQTHVHGSNLRGRVASDPPPCECASARRGRRAAALLAFALFAAVLAGAPASASSDPSGVTAEFSGVPSSHDRSTFSFEVAFSPEPSLSYVTLRDEAFAVQGGEVVRAKRLERGSNAGWRISVEPDGDPVGDVTVVLAPTASCDDSGAICTTNGLRLSNRYEVTIAGPQPPDETSTSTAPADTTPADTGSEGDTSGGTSSNEETTGEDTTAEDTTSEDTTGEDTTGGDTGEDTTGADDGTAAALAVREAEAGRIKDLGDVTDTSHRRFMRSSTGQRSAGGSRFFRFEVTERVLARVGLRALQGDVDLYLEDAAGRTLGSSANEGTADEDIEVELDSGEYFIRVITRRDWRIRFSVRYEMDEPPPPSLPIGSLHPVPRSALGAQQDPPKNGEQSQVVPRQNADDCADGTSTTCTLTIGTAKTGSLEAGGDADWYRVTLDGPQLYNVTVDGGTGSGALGDTAQVQVRHPDAGTTQTVRLRGEVLLPMYASRGSTDPADLVFYIAVSSSSSTATGSYTVTVSERPDDCRADTTDTTADPACTNTVVGRDTYGYHIERPGDIDWIKTTRLTAGTRYELYFNQGEDDIVGLGAKAILGIYKSDGSRIAFTEGQPRWSAVGQRYEFYATEGNSLYQHCRDHYPQMPPGEICGADASDIAFFTPPADGHYFVAVTGPYGLSGRYTLNQNSRTDSASPYRANSAVFSYPDGRGEPPASLPSGPSGTAVAGPGSVNSAIHLGGYMQRDAQRNWHAISLTANRAYEITVTPRTVIDLRTGETVHEGLLNPRLVGIADGNGNEHPPGFFGVNSVGAFGDRQSFVPPTTGTYYIVVEGGPFDWDSSAPFGLSHEWGLQILGRVTTGEYLIEVKRTL